MYHYIVVHRRRFNTIVVIYRRMKKRKKKASTTASKLFVKSCEHILFLSPDKVSLFCFFVDIYCGIRHQFNSPHSPLPFLRRTLTKALFFKYKKREYVSHIPLLAKHDTELICDNKPVLICRYVAELSCSSRPG